MNDLRLSLFNTINKSKPLSAVKDCAKNFKTIINACDGNDPLNNPHNYKFGGTYTTSDGWEYKMEPLATQADEDNCNVSYRWLFDSFEIRGKNFPDAKLGKDGAGLLAQLRGCGAVTEWGFDWTPNDVKFQWYAHGHLPIGTKACVGRAVESAGGTSLGECQGSG